MMSSYAKLDQLLISYLDTWAPPDTNELQQCLQSVTSEERFELVANVEPCGYTALHLAAILDHRKLINCILDPFTDVSRYDLLKVPNDQGYTALHCAKKRDHIKAMRSMLSSVSAENQTRLLNIEDSYNKKPDDLELSGTAAFILEILKNVKEDQDEVIYWNSRVSQAQASQKMEEELAEASFELHQKDKDIKELKVLLNQKDLTISRMKKENEQQDAHIQELKAELMELRQKLQKLSDDSSNVAADVAIIHAMKKELAPAVDSPVKSDLEPTAAEVDEPYANMEATGNELPPKPSADSDSYESWSDEESPNTDSDYDELFIPADLEDRITALCAEHGVTKFQIHQNPKNLKEFVIAGENISTIGTKELQTVISEDCSWSAYRLSVRDVQGEDNTHQFSDSHIKGFPLASLEGVCELLVEMKEENNNMITAHAMGPAHMMFSKEMNAQLKNGEGWQYAKDHIEKTPLHTKYELHFGLSDEERTILATSQTPMFGYRYKCAEENTQQNASASAADSSDDVDVSQPEDSPEPASALFCLNDVALFKLEYSKAEELYHQLLTDHGKVRKLVEIKSLNHLKRYVTPDPKCPIRIRVKNYNGELVRHTLTIKRQKARREAIHLRFTLLDGELVEGDSGSIVWKVCSRNELRPLGMFTGTVSVPAFDTSYYQAVILSKALEDISVSYKVPNPGIKLFNESRLVRSNSGRVLGQTRPPSTQQTTG